MPWTDVGFKRLCTDWILDPQRRKQVCARVVETVVPSFLVLALIRYLTSIWYSISWLTVGISVAVIVIGEFLFYEFILEPFWSWVGPYWERGPRDGTTFTRW